MGDFIVPVYLPKIRFHRFVIYLLVATILQISIYLPFSLRLIIMQIALCCLFMALYQLWEWSRLTSYEDYRLENGYFSYRYRGHEQQVMLADMEVTFLYYSSLDKMKGSATLCFRLKNGKTYRFCGISQVDKLLEQLENNSVIGK